MKNSLYGKSSLFSGSLYREPTVSLFKALINLKQQNDKSIIQLYQVLTKTTPPPMGYPLVPGGVSREF